MWRQSRVGPPAPQGHAVPSLAPADTRDMPGCGLKGTSAGMPSCVPSGCNVSEAGLSDILALHGVSHCLNFYCARSLSCSESPGIERLSKYLR